MTIRWFSDQDRQDMADAREERRVLFALCEEYEVYREDAATEVTPRLLELFEKGLPLSGRDEQR